ncbi:MAG TPA: PorV/PorQ family protein [Niabella sp.]|nr:PorV/PorQ family protein [Niabella sp.]
MINPLKTYKYFTILILISLSFHSQAQFRKYSNEFLNIGAGARGLAMGSAQAASTKDGTAGYWNPAGLINVHTNTQVNLMHSEYFAGIGKYDFANVTIPTANQKNALGVTALRFAVDDIPNTLFLVEPDGTINYNNISTFSSTDYGFLLSYARKLKSAENKNVNFGINAKVIHRGVGSFAKAWGFGFDAGLQIQKRKWQFGIVGKDITTTFNTWAFNFTDKEKEVLYLTKNDIPVKSTELTSPRLVLAAAKSFSLSKKSNLLAEANFDVTFDGKRNTIASFDPVSIDPKIGLEYSFRDIFFLRGGINNFQQALADGDTLNQKKVWIYQPSAGVGFRIGSVFVDYAFANLANQSNPLFTHVFSLRLDFGRRDKKQSIK